MSEINSDHTGQITMQEKIDGNSIRKAERWIPAEKIKTIRDTVAKGLAIRVQGSAAGWYYLTRTKNLKIAELSAFSAGRVDFLRSIVARARAIESDGGNPAAFIKESILAETVEEAEAKADVKAAGAWRWEDLRDRYLEFVQANKSAPTFITYRSNLGAAENSVLAGDYKPLAGKPIKLITPQDILEVRNAILDRGKNAAGEHVGNVRQANHTLNILRSCFRYAIENYKFSGLTVNPAAGVPVFALSKKQAKKIQTAAGGNRRVLTQLELGKIIRFLENWPNHTMRLAFLLQLMTAQRIESVISVPKNEIKKADGWAPYTHVWEIDSDKVGSRRSIPLPEFAADAVETMLPLTRPDNEFLFPQHRPRFAGGSMAGHMSKRGANEIWHEMRKEGGPLEACGWSVAGHDLRRAFITHMKSEWRLHGFESRDAPDLISHKDEGAESTADKIYDLDESLQEKWRIMKAWQEFVGRGYEYALEGISEAEAQERYRKSRMERERELGIQVR